MNLTPLRSGVYVRARSPLGEWWSAPVEALTEESWRVWLATMLARAGVVVAVKEEMEGPHRMHTVCEPEEAT